MARANCVTVRVLHMTSVSIFFFLPSFFGFLHAFKAHCRNNIMPNITILLCLLPFILRPLIPISLGLLCSICPFLSRFVHWISLCSFSNAVICPINHFDLHTWSARPIRAFFKVPKMLGSLYSSSKCLLLRISYSPAMFFYGPKYFSRHLSFEHF